MNEEIAGYVWVDVYLLLEKVTFNNFNVSITDKGITLDMLLSEFEDLDSYSLPDLYAGARRDVERYVDALKEPLNDILYPLFENHTAVMNDDAGTNDIIVFKNGCVWVRRHFRAYVVLRKSRLVTIFLPYIFLKRIYGWTAIRLMMITIGILTTTITLESDMFR